MSGEIKSLFVLCYFSFLHFFIDTCKYIYLYVSVFFSLFIRLTLEKTTLFFTKIHFYFYCEFKKYALCVANELFVLATLLHSTEETFSPAFVIRILLNFPKKQDHCFAPLKKKISFSRFFFLLFSISLFGFSQSD